MKAFIRLAFAVCIAIAIVVGALSRVAPSSPWTTVQLRDLTTIVAKSRRATYSALYRSYWVASAGQTLWTEEYSQRREGWEIAFSAPGEKDLDLRLAGGRFLLRAPCLRWLALRS